MSVPHGTLEEPSPAERRRQRVRTAILEAAERVFATEGEAGLSIRRLAEEIDYSPAAIYKYFDSKDALVDELKEAFFERILELIDDHRQSDAPFLERARDCMTGYARVALEKPHHYAAAFSGIASAGSPIQFGQPAEPVDIDTCCGPIPKKTLAFSYLTDMIREGQALGHFRSDIDPAQAAFGVWAASHGIVMIMIHTQPLAALSGGAAQDHDAPSGHLSAEALEAMIRNHADIFIRGLETRPHGAPHAPPEAPSQATSFDPNPARTAGPQTGHSSHD